MKKSLIVIAGFLAAAASAQMGPPPGSQTRRFPVPKARPAGERNGNPEEYFFNTQLDHFDHDGLSPTFPIRYLIDRTYWDPATGPILFYAGNEGDIYSFYDNTGFMTETVAQETKGLIVFGEHRYFGVSYPFEPS